MWIELAAGAFLVLEYVYHRIVDEDPAKPPPVSEFKIPLTAEGSTFPLIFGRCRVRQPVLAWAGPPGSVIASGNHYPDGVAGNPLYTIGLFFVLGIPFKDGLQHVLRFWVGDRELQPLASNSALQHPLQELAGAGGLGTDERSFIYGTRVLSAPDDPSNSTDETGRFVQGRVEFLNGSSTQQLVDPSTFVATTRSAENMIAGGVPSNQIPGYRGFMCVGLYNSSAFGTGEPNTQWCVGTTPQPDSYSFEVSSYHVPSFLIGDDCVPTDVLIEVLTGTGPGKLGISMSRIDIGSFFVAQETLRAENHGYSRALEEAQDAADVINEIERQVDGVLFEDETTGLLRFKLIRADYTVASLPVLDPSTCEDLTNLVFGGRSNLVNKVRVVFTDRNRRYEDNSVTAQNQASAVGQDGVVREVTLRYPGITNAVLAQKVATRELSARSRPIAKCRAIVDRSKVRLSVGDAVLVNWPAANISNMVMRVGACGRGTQQEGKISLDLIQEVFYVNRGTLVGGNGTVGSFPAA